ncbi:MAG: HlyD family secretion protein [Hyphomicrobium sp.]|nr:HlyD family secretion protein [Hyphomicrobium sp.]
MIAAIVAGAEWWRVARHFESTDDAFIGARQYSIAAKVSGYVLDIPVTDNQVVEVGAPLVRIDDRDYQVALRQSQAQLKEAESSLASSVATIDAQNAQIEQAQAQIKVATAALTYAEQESVRFSTLAKHGNASTERAEQTSSDLVQKRAGLAAAKAAADVAQKQLGVLEAQRAGAEANVAQAKAAVAQAELNVSHATAFAAQRGRVVQLSAAKGQLAQVGQALMMFVPDHLWVIANFKETQITNMRPGQPVDVVIDAYPDRKFHGHVESIQPGSGTAFSLLPAENATGNFVKVTQRIPVKIALDDVPDDIALGPGMSVYPEVRVR